MLITNNKLAAGGSILHVKKAWLHANLANESLVIGVYMHDVAKKVSVTQLS